MIRVLAFMVRRKDLTRDAFDSDGFYRIGDAVRLADPDDLSQGLIFDGRVAEDFKLSTGTWVHVGGLRIAALVATAPVLQDVVLTGLDRDYIGLLAWPSVAGMKQIETAIGEDEFFPLAIEVVAPRGYGCRFRNKARFHSIPWD